MIKLKFKGVPSQTCVILYVLLCLKTFLNEKNHFFEAVCRKVKRFPRNILLLEILVVLTIVQKGPGRFEKV